MGPLVCPSQTTRRFVDLTDVTLADEDTKPILTDNANRAIQGNVTQPGGQICNICKCWLALEPMQVAPPDDQILNQSKLCHLVAKYATNTNGVIWWPNLQLMQVVPSGGQIRN